MMHFWKQYEHWVRYAAVAVIAGLCLWNANSLVTGRIGTMFEPREIHEDYYAYREWINAQEEYFRVLSVPVPSKWMVYTNTHPKVSMVDLVRGDWKEYSLPAVGGHPERNEKKWLSPFERDYADRLLDMSAIKYVVVPREDPENADDFFGAYGEREVFIRRLDEMPFLERIETPAESLVIYENAGVRPHVYVTGELETVEREIPYEEVDVEVVSPSEYRVRIDMKNKGRKSGVNGDGIASSGTPRNDSETHALGDNEGEGSPENPPQSPFTKGGETHPPQSPFTKGGETHPPQSPASGTGESPDSLPLEKGVPSLRGEGFSEEGTYVNFSENYHTDWKVRVGEFSWWSALFEEEYFLDDAYHIENDAGLNTFFIPREKLCIADVSPRGERGSLEQGGGEIASSGTPRNDGERGTPRNDGSNVDPLRLEDSAPPPGKGEVGPNWSRNDGERGTPRNGKGEVGTNWSRSEENTVIANPESARGEAISYDGLEVCENKEEDIQVTLFFRPQSHLYLGLMISGAVLAVCVGYLVYAFGARRRKVA